jgi:hypothetical protein
MPHWAVSHASVKAVPSSGTFDSSAVEAASREKESATATVESMSSIKVNDASEKVITSSFSSSPGSATPGMAPDPPRRPTSRVAGQRLDDVPAPRDLARRRLQHRRRTVLHERALDEEPLAERRKRRIRISPPAAVATSVNGPEALGTRSSGPAGPAKAGRLPQACSPASTRVLMKS